LCQDSQYETRKCQGGDFFHNAELLVRGRSFAALNWREWPH
jgi:hypothetical protein